MVPNECQGARVESDFDFIFFQAEDGIRDIGVTGIQTCALPISTALLPLCKTWKPPWCPARDEWRRNMGYCHTMADHSAGTKDAIQPFVTTRMAGRVLGEVKQAPGTKTNTVGSHLQGEENTSTNQQAALDI